jgi:serpin B
MLFVLPDAVDGLPKLEGWLDAERLDALVQALQPRQVQMTLPRFEVNPAGPLQVGKVLCELGMPLAFDGAKADFTGIAKPERPEDRLFIGEVFHKAFVKVDEKGTEAAAASAVSLDSLCLPPESVPFVADHPFLFFLRDCRTGLILFMGRVADPAGE